MICLVKYDYFSNSLIYDIRVFIQQNYVLLL